MKYQVKTKNKTYTLTTLKQAQNKLQKVKPACLVRMKVKT